MITTALACGPSSTAPRVFFGTGGSDDAGTGGVSGAGGGGGMMGGGGPGDGSAPEDGNLGTGGSAGEGGASGGASGAGGSAGSGGVSGSGGVPNGPPDASMEVAPVDMNRADRPPETNPTGRKAMMVVGDPNALMDGDKKLRGIAQNMGFEVVLTDDGASNVNTTGISVILLASSSVSATLTSRYKDSLVPVLVFENAILDDMNMTGPTDTDYGEDATREVTISVSNGAHPIADGLKDRVAVNMGGPSGCCGVNWGVPAASGTKIAYWGGSSSTPRVAIFAYEKGAVMIESFAAPARRVAMFASEVTLATLSTNGEKLVIAAIGWATAQ